MARSRIAVPATVANLGAGFDIFGLALSFGNTLEVEAIDSGLVIETRGPGSDRLPATSENLAYRALAAVFEHLRRPVPAVRLGQDLGIPLERGLGSSAAAVVGGLRAGAALAGAPLGARDLLPLALPFEGHPDNLAAALWSGFCISVPAGAGPEVVRLDFPEDWEIVLLIPAARVATAEARTLLSPTLTRADAIFNAARCALWVAAIEQRDLSLLARATEDRWHQDARARLFPPLTALLAAARAAGAAGVALAGSGPSVIAIAAPGQGGVVGRALKAAADQAGIEAEVRLTRAANQVPDSISV